MYIIFYSHARNTKRFVFRHLTAALTSNVELDFETTIPIRIIQIFAKGPQSEASGASYPVKPLEDDRLNEDIPADRLWVPHDQEILWVTPTYGQFNHQKHRAENYTPRPMRDAMELFSDHTQRQYVTVGGNRTFGSDFGKQDGVPSHISHVGRFELSGTQTEAEFISANLAKEMLDV